MTCILFKTLGWNKFVFVLFIFLVKLKYGIGLAHKIISSDNLLKNNLVVSMLTQSTTKNTWVIYKIAYITCLFVSCIKILFWLQPHGHGLQM